MGKGKPSNQPRIPYFIFPNFGLAGFFRFKSRMMHLLNLRFPDTTNEIDADTFRSSALKYMAGPIPTSSAISMPKFAKLKIWL